MAFKLKSPFNITNIDGNLPIGKGNVTQRETGVSGMQTGMKYFKVPMAEGDQEVKTETNPKEQAEEAYRKAEKGMPLGLNPKQQARFEVRKYRKGLKDDARFDRQTEKAKKIYKRNEFEAIGEDGAYVDPEKAAEIKVDDKSRAIDVAEMDSIMNNPNLSVDEKEKQVNAIRSRSPHYSDNILNKKDSPTQMLDMEKPNRAGTPVRMLKSMEDKTPMKYKSVRKAARENLMSALAKQGEPIGTNDLGTPAGTAPGYNVERKPLKPASGIKSNPNFATPGTEFKATKPGESNQPKRVTVGDRAKESVKKAVKLGVGAAILKKGQPYE